MKLNFAAAVIGLIVLSAACSRSLDNNPADTVTSGTWRVTLFTDSGNDETSDFAGYIFSFNNNGTMTATKNSVSQNGSWHVDNSSNKFIIDLGPKVDSNKPLGELTDDWKIISATDTEIKLTDDNASSNEFLTFTKN